MSIWNILNIEPTEDQREIKRAYARCLKGTRPDEDPGGFKRLHAAYKQALIEAKAENIPSEVLEEYSADECCSPELANNQLFEPSREANTAFRQLMSSLEEVLVGEADQNDQASWNIIDKDVWMLDDDFNYSIGLALFALIFNHNQTYKDQPEKRMRNPQVIRYLNIYVDWLNKEYELCDIHGWEACEPYFKSLNVLISESDGVEGLRGGEVSGHEKECSAKKYAYYFLATPNERYGTGFFDLAVIICPIAVYYTVLPVGDGAQPYMWAYLLYGYLFVINMMECSPLQASPGKLMNGQKVFTSDQERISIWQAFIRFLTHSALLSGYIFSMLLLSIIKRPFPQDDLSKTMVVDIEKTKALYDMDAGVDL